MGKGNIRTMEELIGSKLPDDFSEFMIDNAGLSHHERFFKGEKEAEWEVNGYTSFKDLYQLTTEIMGSTNKKMIPFAFDAGGWHFCLCMESENFGCIYINRWSDYPENERFIKISNSFNEFIEGLKTEEEFFT